MEIVLIAALVLLAIGALFAGGTPKPAAGLAGPGFGLAMIFVLFAFGGWNEAAYLAGEVRDARRNMLKILVIGILGVTALYLLVNVAYLLALGLGGMRASKAVAADLMRAVAGEKGVVLLALVVCVSALTTMNAAVFTGARTNWALGRDFGMFRFLGDWRESGSTPANALLLQGAVMLVLVGAGAMTPDGFSAMVAYTSPVFWTFFLLTAATLFIFRHRYADAPGFRVPLYPVIPLAFCLACVWMLWSSINYVRFAVQFGAPVLAGIVVMALGVPLYFIARNR
jgi:amino acid transporter